MTVDAIAATDLTLVRGGRRLCTGCDVSVPVGECTVIVGPNGSGKTTLLESLGRLRQPTAGRIEHFVDPPLGYLPQRPGFRRGFTVAETLEYYQQLTGRRDGPPIERLLERVGLSGRADDPVGGLSGGMTRLVGLAVALVGDPAVLLLDEPTSGLDPQMRDVITGLLAAEGDRGRTVVMVTHALEAVDPIADRGVVMGDGAMVRAGSVTELLAETATESLPTAYRRLMEADA